MTAGSADRTMGVVCQHRTNSPAMPTPSINYYVINLPRSKDRINSILAQAHRNNIELQIVEATAGCNLTESDRADYDVKRRSRYFARDLSDNEIACMISHRRALKTFLDSGADYGVILEDDAELTEHFTVAIRELTEHLHGWEAAKLYTEDGELYPLVNLARWPQGMPVPVFPRKILWVNMAYMYTRSGAERLFRRLQKFWRAADAQIGMTLLWDAIPTLALTPSPVVGSAWHYKSDIDSDDGRRPQDGTRSFLQYLRYRGLVFRTTCAKLRMRALMKKRLSRC